MGEEAEDVLTSLRLKAEQASEYSQVKARLDSHFVVRRNVIFERAKFNQRQQAVGETADSFITALYCLAEHCGYGELYSEMIHDRLVVGLRDKKLSEQLQMDPELTLEKAVTRVRQSELVKKQQDILRNNFKGEIACSEVDNVHVRHKTFEKFKQRSGKSPSHKIHQTTHNGQTQCKRCGREAHSMSQCPAREAVCNFCKKKGHYAKVCRRKTVGEIKTAGETQQDTAFLGLVSTDDLDAPWLV